MLAALIADDPTQPALTFYEDTPGDSFGERIELSRKVLGTWVAKAANALQEGFDVHPGSVVRLDLPAPHWRLTYWALAVWAVGATVTLDAHEGADVLVTSEPESPDADDADEVIAVALPALARSFGADLRSGVMDEAREIASYGDDFTAWDEPEPTDPALVAGGRRTTYRELLADSAGTTGRVLVTATDPSTALRQILHVWSTLGSVVLVRGGEPQPDDERMRSEGVDRSAPHVSREEGAD